MPDGVERSAEEREAARLERERRRAGRAPATPIATPPPPTQERAPVPSRATESSTATEPSEAPAGTRRVSRLDRIRHARDRGQPPPGADPQRTRGLRHRSRGRTRAGRIGALVAIVLGVGLLWFLNALFQPFHGSGHGAVTVTIAPKQSSSAVGDLLAHDGVISSSFFFELRATLAGERGDLRPGTYHLKLDMGYGDVLKILTTPPPAVPTTQITIIPGRTRFQLNALLRAEGVKGSYLADTRHSKILRPQNYGAPRPTNSLEGFLFPDTYTLAKPIRLTHLVADQLRRFKQVFAGVDLHWATAHHYSAYQVLIVASMIEAEAATAHDRPLIASVIYNRLTQGIPLGIDATTRYAVNNYTTPLTQSQLNSPSPYNTRNHKGLPPTPIDSPSLAAIQAAAHPANTNYLYFVVKVCGNGEQAFTNSYQQFLALVAQYQAARAKRGGRSPENC